MNLIGSYNYALVALSVLIAIFASYAALDLAGRVTAARSWTRAGWLLGGAAAMGTGIWSMHYIGMLAFILPIPVAYHWPTVLLSLLAAILASVIALYVVSRQKMGASRAVAGSVLMGAGIASMHYIGMAAMRLPAICQFNSLLVVLSVVFAVLISLAALWITFHFRDEKTGIGREKLAGAVVMGAAIPVMHYTGMAAARFTPSGMPADLSHAVSISALGTAGIAAVTFIVLGLALLTSWVDRRFAARTLELQEARLQRSEAYLAEAQRLSRTGSFGWRVSTGEIIWSEETFRLFQYDRTTLPTVELILQRVHPEDAALVKQTIERAARDGKNFEHEYRLVMPDGCIKYVHVVAHALGDESDGIEFAGAVMDVTGRKRAEEALLRSEAYLAEGQKLSQTGTWACDITTREMIHSSEEHRRLFGLLRERVGIPSFEEFYQRIHPDDRGPTVGDLERAMRAGTNAEAHFRVVLPEGTTRYMYGIGHPLVKPRGDTGEFIGTVMDVTERKRAEALRDGESRILEMIARDAPLMEILEKLVRVVEAQFAGLLCSVLLLDEDGQHARHGAAPSLPKPYNDAIDGLSIGPKAGSCGTAMYRRELVVVSDILHDPLWEEYREVAKPYGFRACWSTPILAHSGKALGSFAMYYREPRSPSQAETRALEMATHLAGIAIERKLAREERERLRQAQAELAHINRVTTMGELTASLAHEVNQPIAAAVTDANTCLRWLRRDHPDLEEAREAASRMAKDATRAADIISRIRLLFKNANPQRELVDVNEIVREMVDLLRSEATRYSVSVRTELPDLPQVSADRVQLQQVLMNLIINAIDAMKDVDGTRDLIIRSRQAENGQVLLSVGDTGVGLPQDKADQIFNAFFTTKRDGTGMGLRISRSIIESHGGRLWSVDNSPRGAVFHLTLPTKVEARE
jgi:NO-binding membrane sensor protein with MHYT domain/signal transduction histidine kinase